MKEVNFKFIGVTGRRNDRKWGKDARKRTRGAASGALHLGYAPLRLGTTTHAALGAMRRGFVPLRLEASKIASDTILGSISRQSQP